jgi:hypothetical protein
MPLGVIPSADGTAQDEKFRALQTRQNAIRRREAKTADCASLNPPLLWAHARYGAVVDRCSNTLSFFFVMAGLRPGHPRLSCLSSVKTWMPGTSPGTTSLAAKQRVD